MKQIIFLVVTALMLVSCGGNDAGQNQENKSEYVKEGDVVVEKFVNGNPRLVRTIEKVDGVLVAVYEKEYWDDGNILKEGPLKNGKRDGTWQSFYRDGVLWSEGSFNEGAREGVSITYHPNGRKKYHGFFTNGKKSGTWKFYDEEGEFIKDVVFVDPNKTDSIVIQK